MESFRPLQVRVHPGSHLPPYNAELAGLVKGCFASRLFASDHLLFGDAEERRRVVARRLGWLSGAGWLKAHAEELLHFAEDIRRDGFAHVLLLGMGGSSLCPEVLASVFGRPAHLKTFDIVDSTDPGALARLEAGVDLRRTLFIVASKSGSTVETQSQARYFLERIQAIVPQPGRQFVAITDPGSALEESARAHGFRRVFLNPEDIGGRYSALSYFGMVPAALLGLPLAELAAQADALARDLKVDSESNPALASGALLGAGAHGGCDKLTFAASPSMAPVVPWIEQLVAESTGKSGRGIVPIEAEPPALLEEYGPDRLFCVLRLQGDPAPPHPLHAALQASDRPWLEIECADRTGLAALFLLWECVTAAAGRVLDINPFDEPNVKESKDNTMRLLEESRATGRFVEPTVKATAPKFKLASANLSGHEVPGLLASLLQGIGSGDYLAFLHFGDRTPGIEAALQSMRRAARSGTAAATLRGYGPRYMHSIGQLYKGGAPRGHFVMFTACPASDRSIPGAPYTFGQLLFAQALGDYQALAGRNRPCLWVDLTGDPEAGLNAFAAAWNSACTRAAVQP
jgi:transaldolase / glucose-6-phosphate isomerase